MQNNCARVLVVAAFLSLVSLPASADERMPISRRLPPEGISVAKEVRQRLRTATDALQDRLEAVRRGPRNGKLARLLPDVEIYSKAVDYALRHGEIYHPREIKWAEGLLETGNRRLDELVAGRAPWSEQRGLVVRGYRSRIDDSVQPYGLVIPEKLDLNKPNRLYVWLHGRGDKITDLHFIHRRETTVGTIAPANAIVLHPFGRYCNAFKFAGEVDVFEAATAVADNYGIDRNRIVLWGFSMGGAGVWHLGAHHPDRWVAASPGAGFAETARYQHLKPDNYPPVYEQTLWGLFDVPGYVRNLFNVPILAYSGENDRQIQAAQVMEEAFAQHGRMLPHLIGPGMGHRYHPDVLADIARRIDRYASKGVDRFPRRFSLQTRTLRYNRAFWIEILGLQRHWEDARVDAECNDSNDIVLETRNVSALRVKRPARHWLGFKPATKLTVDYQKVIIPATATAWPVMNLEKVDGRWLVRQRFPGGSELRKLPGLQGPIDDVFMDPFLVVVPSGRCAHEKVERWVVSELDHFKRRWRALFRGELRVKRDDEITEEDLRNYHLILWGDPSSNRLISKVEGYLPIRWSSENIRAGKQSFDASTHIATMIFPNPLLQRPMRYVVLNSGPTFREAHDRTNSLQNPKLPDWAVVDLTTPPDARAPGRIAAAGFFDEYWRYRE